MLVVHGWWSLPTAPGDAGGLVLWAEDAAAPQVSTRRARVRDHPFAASVEDLGAVLDGAPGTADLVLPGYPDAPAASPDLLDRRPAARPAGVEGETVRLYPDVRWRVPTLTVPAAQAEFVLWEVCRRGELGGEFAAEDPTVLAGADLRQVAHLAGFAADLVRRGRVLPVALPQGPGRGVARWRPVLSGPDAEWFRSAVAALPPSYSAALPPPGDPGASAAAALDALVDGCARARLGAGPAVRGGGPRTGLAGWRRALRDDDPTFPATAVKFAELARGLAQWQAEAVSGGAVRACFRLVEPTDDDEGSVLRRHDVPQRSAPESARWRIDLGLQVADEPSLITWADEIWDSGARLTAVARHAAHPPETLLAELGRALRLYPMLGVALAGPRPTELLLDTLDAHAFLAEAAPLLVGAGFGVLLPGWWTRPARRLGARLRAGTPTQPGLVAGRAAIGQNQVVEFDWRLSVGDKTLTEAEVDALIEARKPLVRIRGQWLQVDPERLAKARDFLRRSNSRAGMTVGEVLRVLGELDEAPGGLPVTGVEAEGWLGELLAPQGSAGYETVTAPEGFVGTLRPYQERGLSWLSFLERIGMGGLLADDMGLGKTVQLLALIARDPGTTPTLLVCPMSLVGNWQREAAKFAPGLRVHVHHGAERATGEEFETALAAADLVVTTYTILARDAASLRAVRWHRVVLDEAQAVKNAATQAAIAARQLRTPRRIAVTGTPVENRLADLWSLMEFANPGLLGDPGWFKKHFALPIERLGDEGAGARLRTLTQPFLLRRVKTDRSVISDLPEKLEMDVVCTLTGEQVALYEAVVADMLERIEQKDGMERRGLVLAAMTKLKQVCNHPAQFMKDGSRIAGRSGKIARLEELVEEILAAGEKALLFTQYAEFGETLRTHLSARFGREVAFLHGGVAKARRDELVERFQSGDRRSPPLFVLSLKAGGTGLTLTAANHVIHVDRWWNPAVEDQATDRAYRIGQSRTVQVRRLVCAGTLEEKIAAMLRDKRGLAAAVVGSGEGWLTELDTASLRELFTLDHGVVTA
jgi:superfamily II DNA or RNA helicase